MIKRGRHKRQLWHIHGINITRENAPLYHWLMQYYWQSDQLSLPDEVQLKLWPSKDWTPAKGVLCNFLLDPGRWQWCQQLLHDDRGDAASGSVGQFPPCTARIKAAESWRVYLINCESCCVCLWKSKPDQSRTWSHAPAFLLVFWFVRLVREKHNDAESVIFIFIFIL